MNLRDCLPTFRQMVFASAFSVVAVCGYGPINYYLL